MNVNKNKTRPRLAAATAGAGGRCTVLDMPKQKSWTIRNAHAFLIEKLGIENHAQQMILKNTLEQVAEHYVFEGHYMSKAIEPAEKEIQFGNGWVGIIKK